MVFSAFVQFINYVIVWTSQKQLFKYRYMFLFEFIQTHSCFSYPVFHKERNRVKNVWKRGCSEPWVLTGKHDIRMRWGCWEESRNRFCNEDVCKETDKYFSLSDRINQCKETFMSLVSDDGDRVLILLTLARHVVKCLQMQLYTTIEATQSAWRGTRHHGKAYLLCLYTDYQVVCESYWANKVFDMDRVSSIAAQYVWNRLTAW